MTLERPRKSERERMLGGELYDAADPELATARLRARRLLQAFNAAQPHDDDARAAALAELLGAFGARVRIEPPFRCDYGSHLFIGDDVYFNFNAVVLDCAPITIGDRVLVGPNVQLLAATHPLDATTRRTGRELAFPVTIGSDAWLGAGVIVCPNVEIGERSVIGAGSVVVRDVPSDVFAAGNPCRVIRALT
ncbi:MAG TPA: sugar O-acetyltransferase [Casimicrobiaceae bacterium]|nr:sugar O-acetyltransferase [Casimicrobiaceae bacterium]